MKHVVLDTNAMLLPFSDGTDLEEETTRLVGGHCMVVPDAVLVELSTLAQAGGATARHARAALRWAERCVVHHSQVPGDDAVLTAARELGGVVVTNDKTLQDVCRREGLQVLTSRGHGRLFSPEA